VRVSGQEKNLSLRMSSGCKTGLLVKKRIQPDRSKENEITLGQEPLFELRAQFFPDIIDLVQ